jgi:hypothetical protein
MLTAMTTLANTSKNDSVVARQVKEIFEFEKLLAEVRITTLFSDITSHHGFSPCILLAPPVTYAGLSS